jgi:hypothetical protein
MRYGERPEAAGFTDDSYTSWSNDSGFIRHVIWFIKDCFMTDNILVSQMAAALAAMSLACSKNRLSCENIRMDVYKICRRTLSVKFS